MPVKHCEKVLWLDILLESLGNVAWASEVESGVIKLV